MGGPAPHGPLGVIETPRVRIVGLARIPVGGDGSSISRLLPEPRSQLAQAGLALDNTGTRSQDPAGRSRDVDPAPRRIRSRCRPGPRGAPESIGAEPRMNRPHQPARRPASARTKRTTSWSQVREAETTAACAHQSASKSAAIPPRSAIETCLDALDWPWSRKLSHLMDEALIAEESAGVTARS